MCHDFKLKRVYQNIIAILFFIFFTIPILSPKISGITIYFNFIIPFFDVDYIKYIIRLITDIKARKKFIVYIGLLLLLLCLKRVTLIIEVIAITINIIYLFYAKENKIFKFLYTLIYINIFIAILQFVFLYINPEVSFALGPTNISRLIWGDYATDTFTNFYTIFLFPRVSGWSREAGFFASLLILAFSCYIYDKDEKKTWWKIGLYIVGFIISFSKITLILMSLFLIIYLSKYINRIPFISGVLGLIIGGMIFSNLFLLQKYNDPGFETYTHRFSGYTVMQHLEFNELLFGVEEISQLECREEYPFLEYIERFKEFTGIPNLIIHSGIIISLAYLFMLRFLEVSLTGFVFITIVTLTTSYFTSQSFVILGYFYIFYYQEEFGKQLSNINERFNIKSCFQKK